MRVLLKKIATQCVFIVSLFTYQYSEANSCISEKSAKATIHLGMSTALSGPVQHLGKAMLKGVKASIDEANCSEYWINKGHFLKLTVLDDGY